MFPQKSNVSPPINAKPAGPSQNVAERMAALREKKKKKPGMPPSMRGLHQAAMGPKQAPADEEPD